MLDRTVYIHILKLEVGLGSGTVTIIRLPSQQRNLLNSLVPESFCSVVVEADADCGLLCGGFLPNKVDNVRLVEGREVIDFSYGS